MKIAILGSVALPVPPPAQGGTEWIAYYQAEGLSKLGHKVLLFAARGSKEGAYELIEVGKGDTVVGSNIKNQKSKIKNTYQKSKIDEFVESSRNLRKENIYLAQVIQELMVRKDDYDVILNNMRGEAVFLPVAKMLGKPFVNVMHLPIFEELADAFKKYNTHIITISNAQRKDFPDLNYLATVYNCVDTEKFTFNPLPNPRNVILGTNGVRTPESSRDSGLANARQNDNTKEDYLLMMGSIAPHKNQAAAIRVAKKLGMRLILAGKVGNQPYFESLKSDIDGEQIKWFGELKFEDKLRLYQQAKAFIFPINWPEPFGLVMIEAMACGTPVVAFDNGAIPEVVVNGKTGFVIEDNSEEDMISAIKKIDMIKREDCRKHVEEMFTVEKMVKDYEKVLLSLL